MTKRLLALALLCSLLFACNALKQTPKIDETSGSTAAVNYTEDTKVTAKIVYVEQTYALTIQLQNVNLAYYPEDKLYLKVDVLTDALDKEIAYHLAAEELIPLSLELSGDKKTYVMPKLYTLELDQKSKHLSKQDHAFMLNRAKTGEDLELRVTLYDPWGYAIKSSKLNLVTQTA